MELKEKIKLTAKWIYALWSLVTVRLLIPFFPIKNVLSLYNLGIIRRFQFSIKKVLLGRIGSDSNSFKIIGKEISTRFFINDVLSFDWYDIFTLIWIFGILFLLIIFIYITLKVHSIIRNSYKYTNEDLLNIMESCRKKISLRKNPNIYWILATRSNCCFIREGEGKSKENNRRLCIRLSLPTKFIGYKLCP